MHDFGQLVYMDMHKTGSSQTSHFLRACCVLPEVSFVKHAFLRSRRKADAYYFTTIRNPLSAYFSLFRYGLDGKGGYFLRMARKGHGHLYRNDAASYAAWLRVTLQPDHMAHMYGGLSKFMELGFGVLSARHMLFSLEKPKKRIETCQSQSEAVRLFQAGNINHSVVQVEHLNDGLVKLATRTKPDLFDQGRVHTYFAQQAALPINRSISEVMGDVRLDDATLDLLYARENLIFDRYYGGRSALDAAR
ncbi:MAG: hypothetical protein AAFQ59_01550 [Pseudomonadota bacterium]